MKEKTQSDIEFEEMWDKERNEPFEKRRLLDVERIYYNKGDEVKFLEPIRELIAFNENVKFEDCCRGYRMKASRSLRITVEIFEEEEGEK